MPKQFIASLDQLEPILEYVCLKIAEKGHAEVEQFRLLVEEVVTNIIEHSDSRVIEVGCSSEKVSGVSIVIKDDGSAFNPLEHPLKPIEEAEGLGIHLIKKLADSVEYRRENSCNVLTLVKF